MIAQARLWPAALWPREGPWLCVQFGFPLRRGAAQRPPCAMCAVGWVTAASIKVFALPGAACSLGVGVLGLAEAEPPP